MERWHLAPKDDYGKIIAIRDERERTVCKMGGLVDDYENAIRIIECHNAQVEAVTK